MKRIMYVSDLATNMIIPYVVGSLTAGTRRRARAEAETDTRSATTGRYFVLDRMQIDVRIVVLRLNLQGRVRGTAFSTDNSELCLILICSFFQSNLFDHRDPYSRSD
jgi:hypothetical protein